MISWNHNEIREWVAFEVAADKKNPDILQGKLKSSMFDLKTMYPVRSSNGFECKKDLVGWSQTMSDTRECSCYYLKLIWQTEVITKSFSIAYFTYKWLSLLGVSLDLVLINCFWW